MLPLYLSIEGLYSYQNKQEIDFSLLTEAGLFGIFGNVGSGKSSILEAISYALYGETERLNKQEKRSYNMLNLKSDHAIIDFQFLNFENRKFRFVVKWKRKKRFEETTTIERSAYEWMDEQWIPLESTDGALVTNLSYPNFRRTIIIPQGQFKEFLELKGKDRSDMMKEIFFLNQYDLGPKVGFLQAENNKKVENLKGALTGFEEVSVEIKEFKELELEDAQEQLTRLKQENEKLTELYKSLSVAKENRLDLLAKENELSALDERRSQIQQYEKEVLEFESVSLNFREHINNLHRITAIKEQLIGKIENLQEAKDQLRAKIESNQKQIESIQGDFDNLDNFKRQVSEFQLLLSNVDIQATKTEVLARIAKGTPIITKTKAEEQALTQQLGQEELALEQLKTKRINTNELLAIESWYQSLDTLLRKEQDLKQRLNDQEKETSQLKHLFETNNIAQESWEEALRLQWNKLQDDQRDIQEKETKIRLHQELSQYIRQLHDGVPCPLCGSLDHPNIMHRDDASQEASTLEELKTNWTTAETKLRALQSQLATAAQLLTEKNIQEKTIQEELAQNEEQKNNHLEQFQWPSFDKDDRTKFENLKSSIQELEESISNKELVIKNLRNNIQTLKDNILKYERSLDDFKSQVQVLDAKMNQNLAQVQHLKHLVSTNLTKMELTLQFNKLEEKILHIESQYKECVDKLLADKNQLASISGQFSEAQDQYKSYTSQLQQLQTTINALLIQFQFEDITAVKMILNKPINTVALRETIQQFFLRVNSLTERILELRDLTKNDGYSITLYEQTKLQLQLKSQELETQISLTGSLEKELQRLIIELDKKINLISEFEKLTARKDNLRILDNMFKGNGFVNYVSSIHLQRLCEIANHRFHRLTKNQLSLCVNESNEFEVKDYLNNGYQRSVKTLSGGQSFQASLCLALALAENIQALNKADRNFFFIDEGFGTQDTESINTVFDTLQYLNQENRVVGIISHVEELKERMPRSITVTKDGEKGSQLKFTS